MARKIHLLDADNAAQEYLSGSSAKNIARKRGVSDNVIRRILAERNVTFRPAAWKPRVFVDTAKAIELFNSGIGVAGVAIAMGVGRTAMIRILRDAGIAGRNRPAQQLARMANTTAEERQALTRAAHQAVLGSTQTEAHRCKVAASREKTVTIASQYEYELLEMLAERGVVCGQQTAIGRYNSDITTGSISVEIWGGYWHWYGRHIAGTEKRFRYIMDRGWHILVVCVSKTSPLTPAVADYVVTELERLSRNPTDIREYRVIWRAGKFTTGGRADDDHFSVEPPFRRRKNASPGQHASVTG